MNNNSFPSVRMMLAALILGAAGFAGNWFHITLFYNLDFLFGSIFVMLAVTMYGTLPGTVAAVISASCTYFLWNHPYTIIVFTGEALFVGYLFERRSKNLVLIDTLFWMCAGIPATWILFRYAMNSPEQVTTLIMLKQAINGIFNSLIASFLITALNHFTRMKKTIPTMVTFRQMIGNILIAWVLLPALIFMVTYIRGELSNEEASLRDRVITLEEESIGKMNRFFHEHEEVLRIFSTLVSDPNTTPHDRLQEQTERLKTETTHFLEIGVIGKDGTVLARSPLFIDGNPSTGANMSQETFYRELNQTRQRVVTTLGVKKAGPDIPVITMGVGIPSSDDFTGIAFGVVDMNELAGNIKKIADDSGPSNIILLDREGKVLFSISDEWKPLDMFHRPENADVKTFENGIYQWVPKPPQYMSAILRWRNAIYAKERFLGNEIPGRLIVEVPMFPFVNAMNRITINSLAIMMGLTLLTVALSYYLSKKLVFPLEHLKSITVDIPVKLTREESIKWPSSSIAEISGLILNFQKMTDVLRQNFFELQTVNETLEKRVAERTKELSLEIEERKRAEKALRESQSRLHSTFESMDDLVFVLDRERNFIDFHQPGKIEDLYVPPERFLGRHIEQVGLPPDIASLFNKTIDRLEASSEVQLLDYSLPIGPDTRWYSAKISRRLDQTGAISGFTAVVRDITERKLSEVELYETQQRLQEAQKIAQIGSWDWDIASGTLWWSEETFRIFGMDGSAQPSFDFFINSVHPDDKERVLREIQEAVGSGVPLQIDYRTKPRDGKIRYLHEESRTMCDDTGKAVRRTGTVQDVTNRRLAEQALMDSEERYRTLIDNIPLGITLIDRDYRIIMTNITIGKWFSKDTTKLIGKNCFKEFEKRESACDHCPGRVSMQTRKPAETETEGVRDDGSRISVHIYSVPLFTADRVPSGFIEVVEDITERKRSEEDRQKLEEQLRHSQKMEAVGLLAGGIAHDFNNILTAIIGYTHVTLKKLPEKDPLRHNLEHIIDASHRAANLTRSLLAFSRKQIISPAKIDLNHVISKTNTLLRRVIGEDIELRTELYEAPLMLLADSGQLEQIVMNLATNARDAMPDGGTLLIKTGAFLMDDLFIRNNGFGKKGEYALLTVTDTGTGIDEATRKRIFEPFFTTKEVGRGTGLGLAMVYGAVKQNNGFINMHSRKGEGTTFLIYLPLMERPAREESPVKAAAPPGGSETILIAEDDDSLRMLIGTLLREFGYTVIEAKDGTEAVHKYLENRENVKLLILDVIMPGKDGKEAFDEIRKEDQDIRTLFISGYTADIIDRKDILRDNLNFMTKPIEPQQLLAKIRELLDAKVRGLNTS